MPISPLRPTTYCCSAPSRAACPPRSWTGSTLDHRLRLPMLPGSRSMNLSNAVSVVVFEAWRQNGFAGGM